MKIIKKLFGEYRWFLVFPVGAQFLLDTLEPLSFVRFAFTWGLIVLIPTTTVVLLLRKRSRGHRRTIILGFLLWAAVFVWVAIGPNSITVDV